jgi:ABC-type glutathione transport system ATPase component
VLAHRGERLSSAHDSARPGEPLVSLERVVKEFPVKSGGLFSRSREKVHAVSDVSLEVRRGETLALVGETGCGKSTLAGCVMRLHDLTSGKIVFDGTDITAASHAELQPFRRRMQMVFQNPYGSLNPRRRVGSIIGDPFDIHGLAGGAERVTRVHELMTLVGPQPGALQPVSRRLLWRSAPADRHCPRHRPASRPHRLRRAGLGARRLDPGADPQSARRPTA